jgi:hypothetical protein
MVSLGDIVLDNHTLCRVETEAAAAVSSPA